MLTSVNAVTFFNENDPKYHSCCCHVRSAAKITAALDLIQGFATAIVIYVLFHTRHLDVGTNPGVGGALSGVTMVLFCSILFGLLFAGIKKDKPWMLIPYLLIYYIWLAFAFCVLFMYIIIGVSVDQSLVIDSDNLDFDNPKNTNNVIISLLSLYLTLRAWLQTLVHRCYNFLREKEADTFPGYIAASPAVVQVYQMPATCPTVIHNPCIVEPTSYGTGNVMVESIYGSRDDWMSSYAPPPPYNDVVKSEEYL